MPPKKKKGGKKKKKKRPKSKKGVKGAKNDAKGRRGKGKEVEIDPAKEARRLKKVAEKSRLLNKLNNANVEANYAALRNKVIELRERKAYYLGKIEDVKNSTSKALGEVNRSLRERDVDIKGALREIEETKKVLAKNKVTTDVELEQARKKAGEDEGARQRTVDEMQEKVQVVEDFLMRRDEVNETIARDHEDYARVRDKRAQDLRDQVKKLDATDGRYEELALRQMDRITKAVTVETEQRLPEEVYEMQRKGGTMEQEIAYQMDSIAQLEAENAQLERATAAKKDELKDANDRMVLVTMEIAAMKSWMRKLTAMSLKLQSPEPPAAAAQGGPRRGGVLTEGATARDDENYDSDDTPPSHAGAPVEAAPRETLEHAPEAELVPLSVNGPHKLKQAFANMELMLAERHRRDIQARSRQILTMHQLRHHELTSVLTRREKRRGGVTRRGVDPAHLAQLEQQHVVRKSPPKPKRPAQPNRRSSGPGPPLSGRRLLMRPGEA